MKTEKLPTHFFDILYALYDHQPVSAKFLAHVTGVPQITITCMLKAHSYMFQPHMRNRWRVVSVEEMELEGKEFYDD